MINNIKNIISVVTYVLLFTLGASGCKKLVEVGSPATSTSASLVFSSDATAAAVLTGVYASFNIFNINSISAGPGSLSFFGGLSADEFKLHSGISGPQLF